MFNHLKDIFREKTFEEKTDYLAEGILVSLEHHTIEEQSVVINKLHKLLLDQRKSDYQKAIEHVKKLEQNISEITKTKYIT